MKRKQIITFVLSSKDRLNHSANVINQFKRRDEFNIRIVDESEYQTSNISFLTSINYILNNLITEKEEYILICKDTHQFTTNYSRETFINIIEELEKKGADLLSGGVSDFSNSVQISTQVFWAEKFSGLQFIIIFRRMFEILKSAGSGEMNNPVDDIAQLTKNKFFIYPFISIQAELDARDRIIKKDTEDQFDKSSECLQMLMEVSSFYGEMGQEIKEDIDPEAFNDITIPTYVINLPERTDRREHILKQFAKRDEFDVKIFPAIKHKIGAVGLWLSFRKIVELAIENNDDVIIICEDDHEFTDNYSKTFLLRQLIQAHDDGVNILLGGIGNFEHLIASSPNRYWINSFWSTQFVILYKGFFHQLLSEPFNDYVAADEILSNMTSNKMVVFPFISVQKDFGYSDICLRDSYRNVDTFDQTSNRIKETIRIASRFNPH